MRIKSEKVAEEVTLTEKSRVREIQTKYQEKMKKIIDDEKQKVENQYRWNLENYKRQNMELRQKLSGQNGLVKKLADILLNNEQEILNQRFTFYKMVHKDTFGNTLVPKHGANYEALNRCMLSDTMDALNVEVRNVQGNIAASDPLLSALA